MKRRNLDYSGGGGGQAQSRMDSARLIQRGLRCDANESMFMLRQLDYIKQQTYDIKYPELKARKLIPVSSEADPGAENIFYRQYDQSGLAKIIANYADDLPDADVIGKEFSATVKTIGASYKYSIQEMRAAIYGNVPLEQRKANAARRSIAQKENKIAFYGDVLSNLIGLFNAPNVTAVVIPADGAGATTQWVNKTPDQILYDMNLVANTVVSTSLGVENPDTMLLPIAQYNYVASTARSDFSDKTILNYFLENNPYIKQVEWLNELLGAGQSGSGAAPYSRMYAYRRSPEVLTLEIPSDFEQLELEKRNLVYKVPCIERCAGVLVYYPLAIAYGDGI
jgi:hypothetical protein